MARSRRLSATEQSIFNHIPNQRAAKVRVVKLPKLPGRYVGLTIGPVVFLQKGFDRGGRSELLAHELVHVQQWAEHGPFGFLGSYVGDFVQGLRTHRNWHEAYLNIGFEREAREIAAAWYASHSSCELHGPSDN